MNISNCVYLKNGDFSKWHTSKFTYSFEKKSIKKFHQSSLNAKSKKDPDEFKSNKEIKKATDNNANSNTKFGLDNLDPVLLGRKSRKAFDDLWSQFVNLADPMRSFDQSASLLDSATEFFTPESYYTTVLLIGATGRIGKVILRKLLLRGYNIKVIVRNKNDFEKEIPSRVTVIEGDITDKTKCEEAAEGTDKVIFAAGSRTLDEDDIVNTEQIGAINVIQAFINQKLKKAKKRRGKSSIQKMTLADFSQKGSENGWTMSVIGKSTDDIMCKEKKLYDNRQWTQGRNSFILKKTESNNLGFKGAIYEMGEMGEISTNLKFKKEENLDNYEGIVLRVRGDGNTYAVILTTSDNIKYISRFPTRWGYFTFRLPFNTFRSEIIGEAPLDISKIKSIGIRYENKGRSAIPKPGSYQQPLGRFNIEIDWIKALPGGVETDFVLVSCAGALKETVDEEKMKFIIKNKRRTEAKLRNCGMGYTIIRPGNVIDEPGGYKALVFDQGDRLKDSISAADVADVCVRALHQPLARNKTFEVSHENLQSDSVQKYELIAHVRDKTTNYLGAGLFNLEKNT